MAQLDRFLVALLDNRGTALLLAADDVARLEIGDAPRPVTKQPLTSAQLLSLVREIAPAAAQRQIDTGADVTFSYRLGDAAFAARVRFGAGGASAELRVV